MTVTVTPVNDPPIIGSLPDREIVAGRGVHFSPVAADIDGDSLTFTATGLPTGLTVDPLTGAVTGVAASSTKSTTSRVTLTVSDPSAASASTSFDLTVIAYGLSPLRHQLVITEVLYTQTDQLLVVDEFIEITNIGDTPVSLQGLVLQDTDPHDPRPETDFTLLVPADVSFSSTLVPAILGPGEVAVVWITNPNGLFGAGSFPAAPAGTVELSLDHPHGKLNRRGDDVWLLDTNGDIVDYVAWGDTDDADGHAPTRPPALLNLWDPSFDTDLDDAAAGRSISLALGGLASDTSACWELTGSGSAAARCPGAAQTLVVNDAVGDARVASTGRRNVP